VQWQALVIFSRKKLVNGSSVIIIISDNKLTNQSASNKAQILGSLNGNVHFF
jgi:hypothetical protein